MFVYSFLSRAPSISVYYSYDPAHCPRVMAKWGSHSPTTVYKKEWKTGRGRPSPVEIMPLISQWALYILTQMDASKERQRVFYAFLDDSIYRPFISSVAIWRSLHLWSCGAVKCSQPVKLSRRTSALVNFSIQKSNFVFKMLRTSLLHAHTFVVKPIVKNRYRGDAIECDAAAILLSNNNKKGKFDENSWCWKQTEDLSCQY